MSLAFIGFLAGIAGISVPIILHLMLRRPQEKIKFPSFMFLVAAVIRKSRFNNLSKWIILILRCLALCCLAIAFAWPFLPKFNEMPETATILLWDSSFSMTASNYAGDLKGRAEKIIREADPAHTMMVGAVGAKQIVWSGSFEGSPEKLLEWFNSCGQGSGSSYFAKIFDAAVSKLSETPASKKKIVLVTDRHKYPWWRCPSSIQLEEGIELQFIMPESKVPPRNAAISSAKILNPFSEPGQSLMLELGLTNYTGEKLEGNIKIDWMDKLIQDQKIILPPMQSVKKIIRIETAELKPSSGKAVLEIQDDIKIDNERYFCANPAKLPKIAMAGGEMEDGIDFIKIAFAPSSSMKYAEFADFNVKTFDTDIAFALIREGIDPESETGKKFLSWLNEGGKAVVIWKKDSKMKNMLLRLGIAETLSPDTQKTVRRFSDIDFNHPLFKAFSDVSSGGLYEIMFLDPPSLRLPENASIVAFFDNSTGKNVDSLVLDPAIAEIPVGKGQVIILASGIDRKNSDWPAHPSFLPFWREMLDYLNPLVKEDKNLTVDSYPVPYDGLKAVTDMKTGEKKIIGGTLFYPDKTGSFLVESAVGKKMLSVNVPSEESDTAILPENFSADSFVAKDRIEKKNVEKVKDFTDYQDLENRQKCSLWWPFMAAAIIFALLELILANRTAL